MAKPVRTSSTATTPRKISETDRALLENLGKFCIRARHSNWETVNHNNETEAVALLREMSPLLTGHEYRTLTGGWSNYRLTGNDTVLNVAVDVITRRIQEHLESY